MRNVDADVFSSVIEVLRARMSNAKQNYDAESICEFFKQYVQLQSANAKNSDATYEEGCGLLRVNTSSLESNASDPIDYRSTFEEACKCATSTFNSRQFGYTLPVSDARILGNIRHPFYGTLMFKFMRYINNGGVSVIEIVPHKYTHYCDLVLAAVKQNGSALAYASKELKANRKVVLAAVKQGGWALKWASEDMRGDPNVVLAAVQQDSLALQFASEDMRGDPDVVLAAVTQNGEALYWASVTLKADREVVLVAVKQNGSALAHASIVLRADKEVVLAAVRQNGVALHYASNELMADPNVRRAAGWID
jgi:hypothetical protein